MYTKFPFRSFVFAAKKFFLFSVQKKLRSESFYGNMFLHKIQGGGDCVLTRTRTYVITQDIHPFGDDIQMNVEERKL